MSGLQPLVGLVALAAGAAAQSSTSSSIWPYQTFVSEPTFFPPFPSINKTGETAPGYIIFSQAGSGGGEQAGLIMTEDGELVWQSEPGDHDVITPFKLFGEDVLAYWSGVNLRTGDSFGTVSIIDNTYTLLYNVTLNDPDLFWYGQYDSLINSHEVYITSNNTLLALSYNPIPWNLSLVGGPEDGWIRDGVVYEIDIVTNEVLFKWRASDHIPIERSHCPRQDIRSGFGNSSDSSWDYVHLNSVSEFDGGIVVSSRHTFEGLYINRTTGDVIWRLEGNSGGDFTLDPEAVFQWQHDIRLSELDGQLLFHCHNNMNNYSAPFNQTRANLIHLDTNAKTATAVQIFWPDQSGISSNSGGSFQPLPESKHVWVNFGNQPLMTEFDKDGGVLLTYRIGFPGHPTGPGSSAYRSFKKEWKGCPATKPAVAACKTSNGTVDVYMSWNGATEVQSWNVYSGADLSVVAQGINKTGFEIKLTIPETSSVLVEAVGGCSNMTETTRSDAVTVSDLC